MQILITLKIQQKVTIRQMSCVGVVQKIECVSCYYRDMKNFLQTARGAARLWYDTDADNRAATVSYYVIFAVVPLLLLTIAIHSVVFGEAFIVQTLNQWGSVLGTDVLMLLGNAVQNLEAISTGFGIPVFGTLFFTVMVIMMLNTFTTGIHAIWGMRHRGFRGWLRKSKHSVAFIVIFEMYLFCMLVLTSIVSWMEQLVPFFGIVLFDAFSFLVMTTVLFALAFKILPWQAPALRSRILGSFVASVLLYFARALVTAYIALSPVPGLFGVAGLIVVLLIWVFVSTAIIYYGAAFAFIHGGRRLQ